VSAIPDGETRIAKVTDQPLDRKFSLAFAAEDGRLQGAILADLQKLAAYLVKLAADFVYQVEPP
jgi:hypothetical protein